MKRFALGLGLLLLSAPCGFAQAEPFLTDPVNSAPPVVSSSQRFVFRGFHSEDGLKLSVWSEKMAGKLEQLIGAQLPFQRGEMIRFSAWSDVGAEVGAIRLGQGVQDGFFQQRIGLENPARVEQEQLLESFIAVLLYRYVVTEFRAAGVGDGPVIPDWFAVGVAQSLDPVLRDRNLRYVVGEWESGRGHRVADIVEWRTLPSGRVPQKAYCGLLVDWLKDPIRNRFGWGRLVGHMAAGQPMDRNWIQEELLGLESARDLEKTWDLYLALESNVNRNMGSLTFDQVLELKRILSRYVSAEDGAGQVRPVEVQLRDLIVAREEVWVAQVAESLYRELSEFAVGQSPRMREVVEEYQRFFTALYSPELLDATFRFTFGGDEAVLHKLLKSATDAMAKLEKEVVVRGLYMDRGRRAGSPAPEVAAPVAPVEPEGSPAPETAEPAVELSPEEALRAKRRAFLEAIEASRE